MNTLKLIRSVAVFVFGVILLIGLSALCLTQYQQYRENRRSEAQLQDEIRLREDMYRTLKRKQELFQSDPRFVEKIAREMGMAKEGEVVFKFIEEDRSKAAQPDTQP